MTTLRKKIKRLLLSGLFLFFVLPLYPTTVGSDSVPSRQGSVELSGASNEITGFAALESGLVFEDADTQCTFDGLFPISGTVDLKGGTLSLSRDLMFGAGTNLVGMGTISGNGNKITFPDSVTTVTAFGSSAGSAGSWQQVDDFTWGYNLPSVDWSYDDNYLVSVGGNYIDIYSFNGTTIASVDYIGISNTLPSVRAHPSGYYFLVTTYYNLFGSEILLYKLSGSTLSQIDSEDTNYDGRAVAWTAAGDYAVIGSVENLRIYSFASENLSYVTSINYSPGESTSPRAIAWDQTGDYFVLGTTHATASKLRIIEFTGSSLVVKDYVDTGADVVTSVDWPPTGNFIAAGTDGSSNQLRVYEYNSSTDELTERKKISVGGTVNSVHWNSDATRLLVGKANDTGGTELRIYAFDSGDYSLTLELQAEKTTNIDSARWSNDDSYFVYADGANNMIVYSYTLGEAGSFADSVVLDDVSIKLQNNMSWKMATTIQGNCTIDAGGHAIAIEDDGVITVKAGAQLTLENVRLKGATAQNFFCADNSASIVLKNSTLYLDHDFTFADGSLSFQNDVTISGTNQFSYTTEQASTIATESNLFLTGGATFYYAPTTANRDLLAMTDRTSKLFCNNCTLKSTTTGMRLTKGSVILDNSVTLSCAGTVSSESICFGDGTQANDVDVTFCSGADVTVYGGVHYDNVA